MLTLQVHVVHSHHLLSQCWWYRKWCQLMVQCWVLLLMTATSLYLLRCSPTRMNQLVWTNVTNESVIFSIIIIFCLFPLKVLLLHTISGILHHCFRKISGETEFALSFTLFSCYFSHQTHFSYPLLYSVMWWLSYQQPVWECDHLLSSSQHWGSQYKSMCFFWHSPVSSTYLLNNHSQSRLKNMNLKLCPKWLQITEN